MTDTLDSIHQAFAEYRRRHKKGAYPIALRRRAVAELTPNERLQLAAYLGLTSEQVSRWGDTAKATCMPTQEFFEIPRSAQMPLGGPGLRVEIELPGGAILRMHGQVDAEAVRMLVAAVQPGAVAS